MRVSIEKDPFFKDLQNDVFGKINEIYKTIEPEPEKAGEKKS